MSDHQTTIEFHIVSIQTAMQKAGVWSESVPSWVENYTENQIPNIWQWMQYIYLPMRLSGTINNPGYLAPKINPHIKNNISLTPILQLAIELDALTPTFQQSKPIAP